MEVLILQIFVSLGLVAGSLVLWVYSVRQREHEQSDRLALLALARDDASPAASQEDEQP